MSAGGGIWLPRLPTLSWRLGYLTNTFHPFFFPIWNNPLVESQPVRAWNAGIAAQTLLPSFSAIWWTGTKRTLSLTPVLNHILLHCIIWYAQIANTATSVSGDWMTILSLVEEACHAWRSILVSASSWSDLSFARGSVRPRATTTASVGSSKSPPITSSWSGSKLYSPRLHHSRQKNLERLTLLFWLLINFPHGFGTGVCLLWFGSQELCLNLS